MTSYLPEGIEDSLETRLNKATNPLQAEENWECIVGFCDLINKDVDGPQTAVRLLVHKIQSPQEKESLFALTTLEACVRNCGQRFQQEVGKFRFINEIIKIVSPKYLGSQRTARVKNRCIALLYFWSQILTDEPKIKEAYQMLKKQGIVKEDPDIYQLPSSGLSSGMTSPPPPPQMPPPKPASSKNSIFEDEEKSKLLSRLLKSKNPEDLQAANRLIKNMVKQDEERTEKVTRRTQQLETVSNNVKLLNEMLQNYQPGNSTESDREIMKELSENIEKQRPALFRLASDSDERDSTGIGEILRANDEVIQVLSLYDSLINKSDVGNLLSIEDADGGLSTINKDSVLTSPSSSSKTNDVSMKSIPKDLNDFDVLTTFTSNHTGQTFVDEQLSLFGLSTKEQNFVPTTTGHNLPNNSEVIKSGIDELSDIFSQSNQTNSLSSLIGEFSSGLTQPFQEGSSTLPNYFVSTAGYTPSILSGHSSTATDILKPFSATCLLTTSAPLTTRVASTTTSPHGLGILDELSQSLLQQTLSSSGLKPSHPSLNSSKVTLNQMGKHSSANNNAGQLTNLLRLNDTSLKPLDDIFVPLETITPGLKPPQTIYNENSILVVAHFASETPRPDVVVIATTITSTSKLPIKDIFLEVTPANDEHQMFIKMQPPSSSSLPAYNPILPPSAVTQVVLVACSSNVINAKLKLHMSYLLDDTPVKAFLIIDL